MSYDGREYFANRGIKFSCTVQHSFLCSPDQSEYATNSPMHLRFLGLELKTFLPPFSKGGIQGG